MAENFSELKENVKNAFSKVKEEINGFKSSLKDNNELLLEISKKLNELEKRIARLEDKGKIGLENKEENYISTGNNGVVVDPYRPTTNPH